MGTDCAVIAKLKDGTYKYHNLDRLYVFTNEINNHSGIPTNDWHDIDAVFRWCDDRMFMLIEMTQEDIDDAMESMHFDMEQYINHTKQLSDFVENIDLAELEGVGVFDEHSLIYEDILIFGKNNGMVVEEM
jgi:hypothetical protein